jgi:hypothetical protein
MKNKKVLIIVAVVVVLAVVLGVVLLGGSKEKEYKLGMGVAFGDFTNAQINATVATVVLDDAGKIVLCRIDTIQNKFAADENGVTFTSLKTKMELGDDYNMAKYGHSLVGNETVKEWYEQAKAFESWVVGKTADEVKNMKLQTMDNGYVIADEKDLLDAGCTISIEEFRDAVVKACNDEQGTTFKTAETFTLGVAANNEDNGSSLNEEGGYTVKMNVDFAASVVAGGKILASLNDAMQPQVAVDADGNVTSTSVGKGEGVLKTKRELKEDYKMAAYGTSLVGNEKATEWYIQSAAFSAHIVGMTSADVQAMPTQTMSNGYVISNDKALLDAGCTMSITGIQAVVVESVTNAR